MMSFETCNSLISIFLLSLIFLSSNLYIRFVNSSKPIIEKKSFNENLRLLFVAGIEGTGHHAISSMLKECVKKDPHSCKNARDLSFDLFTHVTKDDNYGLFASEHGADVDKDLVKVRQELKTISSSSETALYFLGLCDDATAGMLSYPNFSGENKALNHPDVVLLTKMSEEVNIDFRIIVLLRDAVSILKSVFSSKKNYLGGIKGPEPRILIDNTAVLYSQLTLIDSKFFQCMNYDDFIKLRRGDNELKEKLVNFVHPVVLKDKIDDMSHGIHMRDSNEYNETEVFSFYATNLQLRLDLIQELCNQE